MFRIITTVVSFRIGSTFEEWVKIFDSQEAQRRHSEFDLKPLFRCLCRYDRKKVICLHHAQEGNIQSLVKQIVSGSKVTKLIFQLWKNLLGYE